MNTLLKQTGTPPEPMSCSTPTTNACKMCTPLGACLAFRGIQGCVPFLHGSQGCATYIRRYLISHFREPMDIASSSFSEETVVFGGQKNLTEGLFNVIRQYRPEMIGIATTCLAETIGDDMHLFLHEFKKEYGHLDGLPELIPVSTPSYAGTHAEGFWATLCALADSMAEHTADGGECIGLCPGMVSPADLRHLHEVMRSFKMHYCLFPDYSETLDGGSWDEYMQVPPGGTPLSALRRLGNASSLISFDCCQPERLQPGIALRRRFGTPLVRMPMPIGIEATDRFMHCLSEQAGMSIPRLYKAERARLVDAYVDGHKITAGKRVAVFGDADFVVPMTAFLHEMGLKPTLCATGAKSALFKEALKEYAPEAAREAVILEGVDFSDIESRVKASVPDLLVGSSKAYAMSRRINIPLLRVGFPIHDRMGGQRLLHLGYRGAQLLFDEICNMLMAHRQESSPVGYTYM